MASIISGSALNGTSGRGFSSFSGSSDGFVASNTYSATAKMGGWSVAVTSGMRYTVRGDYSISTDSGTITGTVAIRQSQSDNTLRSNAVTFASAVTSAAGFVYAELVATATGTLFLAFQESVSGGAAGNLALTISGASAIKSGSTLQLIPSGLSVTDWQDASTNNVDASFPGAGSSVRCEIV